MKSTQIGLLKNVQDGISRPLGSREIQETKVATVLRDTLYFSDKEGGIKYSQIFFYSQLGNNGLHPLNDIFLTREEE